MPLPIPPIGGHSIPSLGSLGSIHPAPSASSTLPVLGSGGLKAIQHSGQNGALILGADGQYHRFGEGPGVRKVERVLVANRGPAAASAIRYLRRISLKYGVSIQIGVPYVDEDRHETWIRMADFALPLPRHPGESPKVAFDDGERKVAVARAMDADAIVVMWGFGAEDPKYAAQVEREGILFVGPTPQAMEMMGHKRNGVRTAEKFGLSVNPYSGMIESMDQAEREARALGFPDQFSLMQKDVYGGGGTGNRRLKTWEEFQTYVRDFLNKGIQFYFEHFFGGSHIRLKRHLEVQGIASPVNKVAVCVGYRDCSWQRRDQKVFEMSATPIPITMIWELYPKLNQLQTEIEYRGAGTFEFLAGLKTDDTWEFRFMEMNTRLQVEHPVTNVAYGVDLFELKLLTAMGYPLPLSQDDIIQRNVSIEARILFENARFRPQAGRVTSVHLPKGDRIILHTGFSDGSNVTPYFDSMGDQLVAWAPMPPHNPRDPESYTKAMEQTYPEVLPPLESALDEYRVTGVQTNVPLLKAVVKTDEFRGNQVSLDTLTEKFGDGGQDAGQPTTLEVGNALIAAALSLYKRESRVVQEELYRNRSTQIAYGKIPEPKAKSYHLKYNDKRYDLEVSRTGLQSFQVVINGLSRNVESSYIGTRHLVVIDGQVFDTDVSSKFGGVNVQIEGKNILIEPVQENSGTRPADVKTPMPGKVVRIPVKEGDPVVRGQDLAIVEAMKMENSIQSPIAGRVSKVHVSEQTSVVEGEILVTVQPESGGSVEEKLGEEELDFVLPSQLPDWLDQLANAGKPKELVGEFNKEFVKNFKEAMNLFKGFFLGFDVVPAHVDLVFEVLSAVLADHSVRPPIISEALNSFITIYLEMRRLTWGSFKREILRLWHGLDGKAEYVPSEDLSRLLIGLFHEYRIPIEERKSKEETFLAADSLVATLNARPGLTRKALLQIMETISWGLADRQRHLTRWVHAAVILGDSSISENLQRLIQEEHWKSPLRKAAIQSLNDLDLAGYQRLFPPPVDDGYAENYEVVTKNPLLGIDKKKVEDMKASLAFPFDENPFQDLPRAHVDVGELKRQYADFKVRKLVSFLQRTAVFELIPKDPKFSSDRRFLVVSWVNQEITFNRNGEGEIDTAPVLERAQIDAIRTIAAYKKFEDPNDTKMHHHANRPVIFAIGQEIPWTDGDDLRLLNKQAALRIAQRVYRFADDFSSFSTRIIANLKKGGETEKKVLRYYLQNGSLDLEVMNPSQDVAKPRTALEIRSMEQRSKGKFLVEERLNLLFGTNNWSEIPLEEIGLDHPGENSAVRIGYGFRQGHKIYFFASDFRVIGGTVDKAVGEKMAWIIRKAGEEGVPLVKLFDSGGARVDSGVPALDGAASTMRETVQSRKQSPIVSCILGPCAGMSAYDPSISEGPIAFVRSKKPMESIGNMYLTGPDVVKEVLNIDVTKAELGGADTHMRDTGVADVSFDSEQDVLEWAGTYLDFVLGLPFDPPEVARRIPAGGDAARTAIRKVVDDGRLFELKPDYGSVLTVLARIGGRNVGIISNYPNNWEEMTYKSLRKMADLIRLCRNLGIPIIKDQRSPWLLGDRMQDPRLARWSDRIDRLFHDVRFSGRLLQYSILYPERREFEEGHANASSDFVIAVVDPKTDPKVLEKISGYADFVIESEIEEEAPEKKAFGLVGELERIFHGPAPYRTDDPHNRKTGQLFDWVLPDRSEEPFDIRLLIQGGDHFQVTKVSADGSDKLFARMVGTPIPSDIKIHASREEAANAPWVEVASPLFPKGYSYRAYKTEEKKVAVQFRLEGHRLEGLFDRGTPFIEYKKEFAGTTLVGWAFLGGELRGVIANQPNVRAAVADKDSSEKIEQFKRLCARLGIRLANLVVMPGFQPGDEEIIDIGGQLLIAEVEYPHAEGTLVVGQNTGGGYIERSSKYIRGLVIEGKFFPFNYNMALPSARIMVMGAKGAVKVVKAYKTAIASAPKERKGVVQKEIERRFLEEVADPRVAQREGSIDEIVSFDDARSKLIEGIEESKRRVQRIRDYQALQRLVREGAEVLERTSGSAVAEGISRILEGAHLLYLSKILGGSVDPIKLSAAQTLIDGFLKTEEPPNDPET